MSAAAAGRRGRRFEVLEYENLPLGQQTRYPDKYAPTLLCAIPRANSRGALSLTSGQPFTGTDTWNAWDLTWLGRGGRPVAATAEFRVPADSPAIIESKSLKLYLNSFSMSEFESTSRVAATLAADLSACAGSEVGVKVTEVTNTEARVVSCLAGDCLDSIDVDCDTWDVSAALLRADFDNIVTEDLHTHLLRSLCPVTGQPDVGSLQISYRGPKLDRAALLQYVVSYRQHQDFHEACIERMFVDLASRCAPENLTIHARYQRRGGIDINPFRTNCGERPLNLRLWRQ
jgi:7-cyano-7-deazaguanine reductase